MPTARILRPAKTAMQSGRVRTRKWILEYEQQTPRQADPLMGWASAGDTLNQVRLYFDTLEEAVAYADANGIAYTVEQPHAPTVKPKAYADNFRYDRIRV
ncbi:MAG TPA: ETC complex I subunit [Stellaceae bacterium]|nr:ETC complex I subunit [Stellaceae bacterium]